MRGGEVVIVMETSERSAPVEELRWSYMYNVGVCVYACAINPAVLP